MLEHTLLTLVLLNASGQTPPPGEVAVPCRAAAAVHCRVTASTPGPLLMQAVRSPPQDPAERAEREWQRAQRQATASPTRRSTANSCAQLQQRIQQLHAIGREGGSARLMERQRKQLRAAQEKFFRLGC